MKKDRKIVASKHILTLSSGVFSLMIEQEKLSSSNQKWPGIQFIPDSNFLKNADILSFRGNGWLIEDMDVVFIRVRAETVTLPVAFFHFEDEPGSLPHLEVRLLRVITKSESIPQTTELHKERFESKRSILAHIENRGDIMGNFGEWIGDPSSLDFIEGFSINVPEGIESTDLSYQALLGNGWDSPWIKSGEFCGSRGLALGLLGLRIRLTGRSAQRYKLTYSAMFSGGKLIGPIKNNNECLCDQSQTMVAFKVVLVPKSHQ